MFIQCISLTDLWHWHDDQASICVSHEFQCVHGVQGQGQNRRSRDRRPVSSEAVEPEPWPAMAKGDPRLSTYDARMDRFLQDAADPDVPLHDSPSSDSIEFQGPGPGLKRSDQRQERRGRPAHSPLPR